MRVFILGSGRMGIRHAQGIINNEDISEILISDINGDSLNHAKRILNNEKVQFSLNKELTFNESYDICIIASTAKDRISQLELVSNLHPEYVLIEKPLGQCQEEVMELVNFIHLKKIKCYVNLNMRLYDSMIQLKNDLINLPQFIGKKTISINTGTVGIGANGIHYLDLLYFLLNADNAVLINGIIEDELITSGRGDDFGDFGGWAVISYSKENIEVGTALISLSNYSTAFGSWEIIATNGRVWFNEVDQKCTYSLRKENSELPVHRYYGDYLPNEDYIMDSPVLGDLTNRWITNIIKTGESNLPSVENSLVVHKLLFDWLSKSKTHKNIFPIT